LNRLFIELRRRNVFRVAGVYAVVGWLLTQVAATLEGAIGLPGWFDGFIVAFLLIGFPIALILAWAFELTPEGVKPTAPAAGAAAAPKPNRLDYAILAGVGLVAFLFAYDRFSPQSQAGHGDPAPATLSKAAPAPINAASIAVLPFADMSSGGDQEYFSDGMAEEILNSLARVKGLKVASRTSSFQFRGAAQSVPAIADSLGVRHILEGSVRKAGDTIRVTAQLIDAETDAHLWSETFDRRLSAENIFAIQSEIAAAILSALKPRIGVEIAQSAPKPSVRTSDVGAYELFLKARALYQSRRDLGEADHLLEQALALDPEYADALAIRAGIHQFGGEYGARLGDEREARARGKRFAEEALKIDPDNADALAIQALSRLYDRIADDASGGYPEIFADFSRALEIDPANANALNWVGIAHAFLGEHEKAADVHQRCIAADPALAACRTNLVMELLALGRLQESEAVLNAALADGAFASGPGQLILLATFKRRDAFLALAPTLPALRGYRGLDRLYAALTSPEGDNRAVAEELKAVFAQNEATVRAGVLLVALGDYSQRPVITTQWGPLYTEYRRSPAFKRFMRETGADQYWRAQGFPPQCKPAGKDDFECR